jgi:hypothetical protein
VATKVAKIIFACIGLLFLIAGLLPALHGQPPNTSSLSEAAVFFTLSLALRPRRQPPPPGRAPNKRSNVQMNRPALFLVACALGGFGGALGSIVGHAIGEGGLWAGASLGGLLASMLIARIALWRRWIVRSQYWPTVLGTAIGFLLARAVAVNTLSSPVGPILSTLLIGVGAVLGSLRAPSAADPHDHPA